MATFVATTACNGPRLKDPDAVRKILDHYIWDGDVEAVVWYDQGEDASYLHIHGYDWPACWKVPEGADRDNCEPDYNVDPSEVFEDFLKEIAPFLAEPLTVHAVGTEKCRFPISACEWYVQPGARTIEVNGFKHWSSDEPENKEEPEIVGQPG